MATYQRFHPSFPSLAFGESLKLSPGDRHHVQTRNAVRENEKGKLLKPRMECFIKPEDDAKKKKSCLTLKIVGCLDVIIKPSLHALKCKINYPDILTLKMLRPLVWAGGAQAGSGASPMLRWVALPKRNLSAGHPFALTSHTAGKVQGVRTGYQDRAQTHSRLGDSLERILGGGQRKLGELGQDHVALMVECAGLLHSGSSIPSLAS